MLPFRFHVTQWARWPTPHWPKIHQRPVRLGFPVAFSSEGTSAGTLNAFLLSSMSADLDVWFQSKV